MSVINNTLFVNFNSEFMSDCLLQLANLYPNSCYIIANNKEKYKSLLKKSKILNYSDLLRLNVPTEVANSFVLDSYEFEKMSVTYIHYLRIIKRLSRKNISLVDAEENFIKFSSFIKSFLISHKITIVIFESTPHMGFDYLIYEIAKSLKIDTYILERTYIANFYFFKQDIFDTTKVPSDFFENISTEKLKKEIPDYIRNEIYQDSIFEKNAIIKNNLKNSWINIIAEPIKLFIILLIRGNLFKESNISSFVLDKNKSNVKLIYSRLVDSIKYNLLKKFYISKSTNYTHFNFDYVYFPLHLQPERSTTPLGGHFENQYLAIELLRKVLPAHIKILVKEHPRQLNNIRVGGYDYRDKKFYSKILSLPNVELTNLNIDNNSLIENSLFIATISGSSGWQALLKRKAVVAFGYPWYSQCNACFLVRSEEDLQNSFQKIKSMDSSFIEKELYRYLLYIHASLFPTAVNTEMLKYLKSETSTLQSTLVHQCANIMTKL